MKIWSCQASFLVIKKCLTQATGTPQNIEKNFFAYVKYICLVQESELKLQHFG